MKSNLDGELDASLNAARRCCFGNVLTPSLTWCSCGVANMNNVEWVSIEDAAKILFVAKSHVRKLIAEGKLSNISGDDVLLAEVLL
jgi:hypothetical protein